MKFTPTLTKGGFMKHTITILSLLLVAITCFGQQKFNAAYTVTFDSLTLPGVAVYEDRITDGFAPDLTIGLRLTEQARPEVKTEKTFRAKETPQGHPRILGMAVATQRVKIYQAVFVLDATGISLADATWYEKRLRKLYDKAQISVNVVQQPEPVARGYLRLLQCDSIGTVWQPKYNLRIGGQKQWNIRTDDSGFHIEKKVKK